MDFVAEVKKRYSYLSDEDISAIVNKAKMFYYSLTYPCGFESVNETDNPIKGFVAENWILAACDELIERLGFSSVTGYSENGVRWTFSNEEISERLISLIKGHVRTF